MCIVFVSHRYFMCIVCFTQILYVQSFCFTHSAGRLQHSQLIGWSDWTVCNVSLLAKTVNGFCLGDCQLSLSLCLCLIAMDGNSRQLLSDDEISKMAHWTKTNVNTLFILQLFTSVCIPVHRNDHVYWLWLLYFRMLVYLANIIWPNVMSHSRMSAVVYFAMNNGNDSVVYTSE